MAKPADLILVTDIQNDHLDVEAIGKIRKSGTVVLIPASAKDRFPEGTSIANGETKTVAGIKVEAVASYDLLQGDPFHPSERMTPTAAADCVKPSGRRWYALSLPYREHSDVQGCAERRAHRCAVT
jgi:L-ascorbate metabolism protein UlaG (beta-lactamase superfamily)